MADQDSTTRINVDVTKFNASIQEAKRQIKLANAEFNEAASKLDNWGKSTEGVQAKLTQLTTKEEAQKKILEELKDKYKAVAEAEGEDSEGAEKLRIQILNQEAAINRTEREIAGYNETLEELEEESKESSSATSKLKEKITEQEKELEKAKKKYTDLILEQGEGSEEAEALAGEIESLSGELQQNRETLSQAENAADEFDETLEEVEEASGQASEGFSAMKVAIGNLIADGIELGISKLKEFAQNALETGRSFESAMSEVKAISGANGEDLEKLTETAREYGKATQYSATESAEALKYMALAGWDANESTAALGGILNLAAASGMDLGNASDIVTDYLSAFGLTANDAAGFVDKMAYAMSSSNTSTEQLGEAYKNCAATSTQLGYGLDETTAALMVMADSGIKGGEAGTALSAIMTRLGNNVSNCRDLLEGYGITVYDSEGNVQSLTSILNGMKEVWADLTDEQKSNLSYVVAGKTAQSELMTVLGESTGSFAEYAEGLTKCSGAAEDMAKTMNDNLEGDLKTLNSAYEDLGITMYNKVSKPMREIAQRTTTELVPAFSEIINGSDGAGEKLGESLGGIVQNLGEQFAKAVPTIVSVGTELIIGLILGITAAFPQLIQAMLAAIPELITALAEQLPTIITAIIEMIPLIAQSIVANLPQIITSLLEALPNIIGALVTALLGSAPLILEAAITLFFGLVKAFKQISEELIAVLPEIIKTVVEKLIEMQEKLGEYKEKIWEKLKEFFENIVEEAKEKMGEFVTSAINEIKQLPEKILTWFDNTKEKTIEFGENMKEKATDTGKKFITNIIKFIQTLPSKLGYYIGYTLTKVILWTLSMKQKADEAGSKFVTAVIEFIKTLPSKLWAWLLTTTAKVESFKKDMEVKAKEAGKNFIEKVIEFIKTLPQKTKENFDKTIEKAKEFVTNLGVKGKEAGSSLLEKIKEGVKDLPSKMQEIGTNIVTGVWQGIQNAKAKFMQDVKDFFGGITTGAKAALEINSPSRVMRDQVGKNIDLGIAEGIKRNKEKVKKAMQQLMKEAEKEGNANLNLGVNAVKENIAAGYTTMMGNNTSNTTNNNSTYTFNQYNTSPKALSRLEIYRQTQRQLKFAKGV